MKRFELFVEPIDKEKRIDTYLTDVLVKYGVSRSLIKELIKEKKVILNNKKAFKVHYKVRENDRILIDVPEKGKIDLQPQEINFDIVYEDDNLIVVNKPIGLVVHPAPGNIDRTLVNALLFHTNKLSNINPDRPGIVHRLDKDTSGLLVVAKDNSTHLDLSRQFAQRKVKKMYVAVVEGEVEFAEGVIDIPISRNPRDFKKMRVSFHEDARKAKTFYKVLCSNKNFTLLELKPVTGRTHQLRVHMRYLGYPILGDAKYSNKKGYARLFLHAKYLKFMHPVKNKVMEFNLKIPKKFKEFFDNKIS
ncbi:MAG: RluA family pseudouridine synthase [Candidatus Gygaella obscura]|nr:RluA family pseudouridine synthase [Candidatus Gygaella obscura]